MSIETDYRGPTIWQLGRLSPAGLLNAENTGPDRFADVSALQWVSAFATGERLVLGQVALVDGDKGGEIAAAQQLIQDLGIKGQLFTLDALHCQKNTAGRTGERQRRVDAA
jgi:hypothetical protein